MIFITGAAGFIGSNFTHYLAQKGFGDIVILDNLTYAGDLENLYDLEFPVVKVDISNEYLLAQVFKKYKENE